MTRVKNELNRNEDFMKLYNHLECIFAHIRSTSASGIFTIKKGEKFFYSHPKLKKLEEIVVEHFKSWNAQNTTEKKCDKTRVMIFSSFRDSVQEIAEMLLQHQPVIRAMTFVGHASGKSTKGFTQKEQLEVIVLEMMETKIKLISFALMLFCFNLQVNYLLLKDNFIVKHK
uniref:FA complementation group M n=1 Tax=Molossus molossus TaxID=27622 RepID=A0A7J8JUP8_MOLMO|nr:FA complementation group M [Molossus molossus]